MGAPSIEESSQEMLSPSFAKFKDVTRVLADSGYCPSIAVEEVVSILKQCGKQKGLLHALRMHAYTCECGLDTPVLLGNCLIEMLVEVGNIQHAQMIFNRLPCQEECAWNCLIEGYADCGELKHALTLYTKMQTYCLRPTAYTYVALLKACTLLKDLQIGHDLHEDIVKARLLGENVFLGSTLINMYGKGGSLSKARDVFDKLMVQNVVSWNSLIAGYSEHGFSEEALNCFIRMHDEGILPDAVTFVCSMKACGKLGTTRRGKELHTQINRLGLLKSDIFVGNALVDMYVKFGMFDIARYLFTNLPSRNLVSWNVLIAGYADYGLGEEALDAFEQMQQEAVLQDAVTFVCSLKACGTIGAIGKGREIHHEIIKRGYMETDAFAGSALVDMYKKCKMFDTAQNIFSSLPFRDVVAWNAVIPGQVEVGHVEEVLFCIEHMRYDRICPDSITFAGCLKACSSMGAGRNGQEMHTEVVKQGLESDPLVGSSMVDMYFKGSLLLDAQKVFDELPSKVVVTWNALIAGYVEQGHSEKALNWFDQMQKESFPCNALTLVNSLRACGSIGAIVQGREIHSYTVKTGFLEEDAFVGSTLVDMYAKCGLLLEAQEVFDKLLVQDMVSWTALVSGYVELGWSEKALCCFEQMQHKGVSPGLITIGCCLKACSNMRWISKGQEIHVLIVQKGLLEIDSFICSVLIDLYVQNGSLPSAQDVFNKLPLQDRASWTALMLGFLDYGNHEEALYCLEQMHQESVPIDSFTFICGFKAIGNLSAIVKGREIHSDICKIGLEEDLFVGNAVVDMYFKCGCLEEAHKVFDKLPDQDFSSWGVLMAGYADCGYDEEAFYCFEQMRIEGVAPSVTTYVNCMKVCGNMQAVASGHGLHSEIIKIGYDKEIVVGNAVVDMYTRCCLLTEAKDVFDSISSPSVALWNVLVQGNAEQKSGKEAINLFEGMKEQGVCPDVATYINGLKACGMMGALRKGQEIHAEIARKGLERESSICNTVVDMYAKCGLLESAQEAFNRLLEHNTVSWTALISGYVGHGDGETALSCFDQMQHENTIANAVTLVCCLKACSNVGALDKGRELHLEIAKKGLEGELLVGNTLIDMYGKCGLVAVSQEVINKLPARDAISWNALIAGYAQLGDSDMVFHVFEWMLSEHIWPNSVTMISVLKACSHSGLLDKSHICFDAIRSSFNLKPTLEHYTCMVDTLGRAGHVDKAMALVINMPSHPCGVVWHTVLGACLKEANVVLALHAFGHLVQLDETNCAAYVCLSNIYAVAGTQEGCEEDHAL